LQHCRPNRGLGKAICAQKKGRKKVTRKKKKDYSGGGEVLCPLRLTRFKHAANRQWASKDCGGRDTKRLHRQGWGGSQVKFTTRY